MVTRKPAVEPFRAMGDPTRREILHHLEPQALAELRAWLDAFWSRGLARIRKSAEGRGK